MTRTTTPAHAGGRVRIGAAGAGLLAAMLLLGWAVHDDVPGIDAAVRHAASGTAHTAFGHLAMLWLGVFNPRLPQIGLVLMVLWTAWAALRGRRDLALLLGRTTLVMAACAAEVQFKYLFRRELPIHLPPGMHRYAYPSGHTTAVAAFAIPLVILTARLAHRHWRTAAVLAAAIVTVTATCLVALGAHYFTDVVGATLGTTGVALLTAALLDLLPAKPRAA
ncbi:phosphatase PAP2 family protein [Saccharopolyspora rosea]|uniref:Phosphatase PAP2 family protein n=1 Tax=Saccharopolyspora rosea TaxID=524884 RepID=A0ABW3G0V8_9PSEU|nr:phosphatase PAP2 family protein [Saccharopolyspora rosea]